MDPTLPDSLKVIALEWREAADDLAGWAMARLVNRRDRWVQFGPPSRASDRPYSAVTLPSRSRLGRDVVSMDKLERHFGSFRRQHLIGLHAGSADGTCRWLAVDLDLHKPDEPLAEVKRAANWRAGLAWWSRLYDAGHPALLLDSNGAGGLHLLLLFSTPVPQADTFALGQRLTDDWEAHGLLERPETYPNAGDAAHSGGALRVPGLHHYRDHVTRVYSAEPVGDQPWLEGRAAVRALLEAQPLPPDALASLFGTAAPTAPARAPRRPVAAPTATPPFLVDLDGVLAAYDGWESATSIGALLPGARDFLVALAERGPVHVFSARLHEYDETALRAIEAWVAHHALPVDAVVWGKPPARAIIDDRAVPCRPQETGPRAFSEALRRVDALRGRAGAGDDALVRILDLWPTLSPRARHRLVTAAEAETDTDA